MFENSNWIKLNFDSRAFTTAQLVNISNNNGFLLFGIGNCKIKEGEIIHYFNYNITPLHIEYSKLINITTNVMKQIENNPLLEEQSKALSYFSMI